MALQAERTGPGGRPAIRAAPPWRSSGRPGKVTAAPQPGPTARGLCCSSASPKRKPETTTWVQVL